MNHFAWLLKRLVLHMFNMHWLCKTPVLEFYQIHISTSDMNVERSICASIWFALFTSDLSADSLAFAEDQASSGSIACLNIWSQDFSPETMMSFSLCKNRGDVFHLNTESGLAHGSVEVTDFPIGTSGSHYVNSLKESGPWQYLFSIKRLIPAWQHCLLVWHTSNE